jgi:hypothetical protein
MKRAVKVGGGLVVLIAACAAGYWWLRGSTDVVRQNQLSAILVSAKYTMLPFPAADLGPGAIVKVIDSEGGKLIEVYGHLESTCGAKIVLIRQSEDLALQISAGTKETFDGEADFNLSGISAGPQIKDVKAVTVSVSNAGAQRLDVGSLIAWLLESKGKRLDGCDQLLGLDQIAIVRDAFAIDAGEFEAQDDTKTKLDLGDGKYFKAGAGAAYESQQTISFSKRMYVAVKTVSKYDELAGLLSPEKADEGIPLGTIVTVNRVKPTQN